MATWCKLTHCKRPWFWERLKAGGEGDVRGWDGWMASPTQWTWVWLGSWSWWWTGKPGLLQSIESQSWIQLSDLTELTGLIFIWLLSIWTYALKHKFKIITVSVKMLAIIMWTFGAPDGSVGKRSACNAGDLSSIHRLGRSPGEGKGYPLQYYGLENQTWLSNFHVSFYKTSCENQFIP